MKKKLLERVLFAALIACSAYLLVSAVGLTRLHASGSRTFHSWGLGFGAPGSVPTGPMDSGTLEKVQAKYLVCGSDEKKLALTFDVGYENGHTAKILDTLQKTDVKALFFVTGHFVSENAALLNRMKDEGHLVGNHTSKHPDMKKKADSESFSLELTTLNDDFRAATGKEIDKYYRPPGGVFNLEQLEYAKEMGYTTLFWSLAYVDWEVDKQPSRETAFNKLLPRTHPGAIVLLHTTSATNADILEELIAKWKDAGYEFVLP